METLYSILVSTLIAMNAMSPSTKLPDVLGTRIAQNATDAEVETDSLVRTQINSRLLEKRREVELRRTQIQTDLQERKEDAASRSADKREEFQTRLQDLKNEREKRVLTNLDSRFVKVNEKWVNHWNSVLSRLEEILAKLETRLEEYSGDIDTTALTSAISEAQLAINDAQEAVNIQAGKTYVIELSDGENTGQNIRTLVAEFKDDIKGVWTQVREAREAVHDVFVEVRKITNLGNNNESKTEE